MFTLNPGDEKIIEERLLQFFEQVGDKFYCRLPINHPGTGQSYCNHALGRKYRILGHLRVHLNFRPFICGGDCGAPDWYVVFASHTQPTRSADKLTFGSKAQRDSVKIATACSTLSQTSENALIGTTHPFISWSLAEEGNYPAGAPHTGRTLEVISETVKGTPCAQWRDRALLCTMARSSHATSCAVELTILYPFTHISSPRISGSLQFM
jgi:hypothetical protein